jgi:hypothetical protein
MSCWSHGRVLGETLATGFLRTIVVARFLELVVFFVDLLASSLTVFSFLPLVELRVTALAEVELEREGEAARVTEREEARSSSSESDSDLIARAIGLSVFFGFSAVDGSPSSL